MAETDPRIDAYIEDAADFAKPILRTSARSCTRPVPTWRRPCGGASPTSTTRG